MLFNVSTQFRGVLRSLWPQPAVRLIRKGARLRERGKLDEAVAVLDEAIRLDSRMAEAYTHRCACYCDLDEYAKAMELGSAHPGSSNCAVLAAAYAEGGNFDEAVRWQTERLAAVPDDVPKKQRLEREAILEKYRARMPHRMSGADDSES